MKNVIVGPAFPFRGGIADFNEQLCRAFNKAGDSSSIATFTKQYPEFLFPGKTQFREGEPPEDIKIFRVINSTNPLSWVRSAREIRDEEPDFVIIRYWLPFMAPCLGSIARFVKRNTKIKIIALTDNIIPHEKRIGDEVLTSFFLKGCDGYVTMSHSVQEDLKQFIKEPKVKFIPHPVYDQFGNKISKKDAIQKLQLSPDYHYLLFFGFIRKYKGLELLIRALAQPELRSKKIKLIVAGEFYEDSAPYYELVKQEQLQDSILFFPQFIAAEDVKYYFCAADMVVQPYLSATQSGVTQIAYNFERPMLVTNVGGLPEMVPHNKVGYAVEPKPEAIASAIKDFYDGNKEELFSANAAKEKFRFSWEAMVNGINELVKIL